MKLQKVLYFRATLAGAVGTAAMTLATVLNIPLLGIHSSNPVGLLSKIFFGSVALGWISHFLIGIVLAYIYAACQKQIPGPPILQGSLFSLIPWFIFQVLLLPVLGYPILMGSLDQALLSIFRHTVYGIVLGWVYGTPKKTKSK